MAVQVEGAGPGVQLHAGLRAIEQLPILDSIRPADALQYHGAPPSSVKPPAGPVVLFCVYSPRYSFQNERLVRIGSASRQASPTALYLRISRKARLVPWPKADMVFLKLRRVMKPR